MPAATLGRDAAGLAPRPAPHDAPALRLSALLWLGWVVFVVYGSLLPFDFHPMPLAQALAKFRHVPFYDLGVASRGDWVANGVLYLPVGVLTARLLAVAFGGRAWVAAVLLTLVFGLALATAVEFAQLCFPPRTVSQNDLMAESLGTLVGALVAPWLSPWSRRLRLAMRLGGPRLGWQLLEVYAAAYLLMCFFPYDLLLSVPEWQDRLAGEGWGWLLAPASVQRGWRAGLLLTAEVALMMPFGLLLAGRHGGRRGPGLVAAGLLGCGLGVLIEAGQLAIASGVVQGASVLTRGLGVALGAWLWRQSRRHWPPVGPSASAGPATLSAADRARRIDDLRRRWRPQLQLLTIAYLVLLPAANGWFSRPLQSAAGIAAQWGDLRLMPFFYHYFTTEAEAMFSLGSVAVMYLPVPGLAWALGWRTRTGLIAATVLAPVVETGKLLFGVRPDPTDC